MVKARLRALTARARLLRDRALEEHSTPHGIGFAISLGTFVAFTPFVGFHIWIALALASLVRLNRLWAMLASHFSPPPVFLAVSFLEIETGHRLRAGCWVAMTIREVATQGRGLLVDWLLGTIPVAGLIAVLTGLAAYYSARRWNLTPRSRGEARPPSSESRRSAPPAPPP